MPSHLDLVEIPKPCPLKWEQLRGDDHRRFCPTCSKHVQNLSTMTRSDAETLLSNPQPGCVTFERDRAGRVVTLEYGSAPRSRSRRGLVLMWIGIFAGAMQLLFGQYPRAFTTGRVVGAMPCTMPTILPVTQPAVSTSIDTSEPVQQASADPTP